MNSADAAPSLRRIRLDGALTVPPTRIHGSVPFQAALAAGRFETTACAACGQLSFPPVAVCPACRDRALVWRAVPPGGMLFSATRVHMAPCHLASMAPYRLGIVDLDVRLRLLCLLVYPDAREPRIGERVVLVVADAQGGLLLAAVPDDLD